jgi:hypothetical protein
VAVHQALPLPAVSNARELGKRVLPERAIESFRRTRALLRYLRSLSREVYDRQQTFHVEELEGRLIARRPDITDRLMKDLLERTDLLLQELHREVEGIRARQGSDLRAMETRVEELAARLDELRADLVATRASAPAPDAVR